MYPAVLIAVVIGGYLLSCLLWPYKACPRCGGNGKRRAPVGGSWRKCPRCSGTGDVLRTGRKVLGGGK